MHNNASINVLRLSEEDTCLNKFTHSSVKLKQRKTGIACTYLLIMVPDEKCCRWIVYEIRIWRCSISGEFIYTYLFPWTVIGLFTPKYKTSASCFTNKTTTSCGATNRISRLCHVSSELMASVTRRNDVTFKYSSSWKIFCPLRRERRREN